MVQRLVRILTEEAEQCGESVRSSVVNQSGTVLMNFLSE